MQGDVPAEVRMTDQLGREPERAAFEAAAVGYGLPLAREPEWHPLGQPESARPYYAARTNAAWWAWQASQAAERERWRALLTDVSKQTRHPDYDWPACLQRDVDEALKA